MRTVVELLAPVGSKEALVAALESGADAVYLGGKMFGARHYAPNFTDEELAEAVRLAHLRGISVYVTVNTLVDNGEMPLLIDYLRYLYTIGVDAIIVQDIGVACIAKTVVPHLPIHASTQMTVHNLAGVQFLAEHGFTRAVLARELSLDDIAYICRHAPIEIETFIHGALCICYSGQCLMSSLIGGRSGNRGRCAQPCRLPYTLVDKEGRNILEGRDAGEYLLSPKDLKTIEHIPRLIEAGVVSLKIEGRMKRPEYVAVVVDTYRRAIDAYLANKTNFTVSTQDHKDLAQIFNRDFTTAYLFGKEGRFMMSDRRPNNRGVRIGRVIDYSPREKTAVIRLDEPLALGDMVEFWVKVGGRVCTNVTALKLQGQDVPEAPAGRAVAIPVPSPVRPGDRVFKTFDAKLMERARAFFNTGAPLRRIAVDAEVDVGEGRPLTITFTDVDGFRGAAATNFIAERAIKRPLTAETVKKQLERLGTTVFALRNLICRIEGEVMVPLSEINEARRKAVEALEQARLSRYRRPDLSPRSITLEELCPPDKAASAKAKTELIVNVDTLEKLEAALVAGADWVLYGGETYNHRSITADEYRQAVELTRYHGRKIILNTPRLVKEWQIPGLRKELELFTEICPDGISVGNLGSLHIARQICPLPLHADFSFNIYNSAAVCFLTEQGVASLTLSPELNFDQIEKIAGWGSAALECIVHGYLPLMVSEYCVVGSFIGALHTGNCNQACLRGEYWLRDRMNEKFAVATDQFCRMHILNAKELNMLPHVMKFIQLGIDRIRIETKTGDPAYVQRITQLYRQLLDFGEDHPLLIKGDFSTVEHADITRGHYFRGVL